MFEQTIWAWVVCAVAAYLLGSISGAITTSGLLYKTDIRSHGSGNAGLTNALRTFGKKTAVVVTAIDVAKTAAALLLGIWLIGDMAVIVAGAGVVIGHAFPVYYRFKGGKCVLSSAVILVFLDWRVFLLTIAIFGLVTLTTKIVAVGSLAAAVTVVPLTAYFFRGQAQYIIFISALAVFVIVLHRGNIRRLLQKNEHKLGKGSEKQ